ncbi:MAG: imelysin family protein [Acidimicrobiia bacterium]
MRLSAGVALTLILAACSSGPGEADVVSAMADDALIPAVQSAATATEELATAAAEFCGAPSAAGLEAVQESWRRAKSAWERSELTTFFGPAEMLRTLSKVDYSPISEPGIDELLSSEVAIDVDYIDNRAASTQRGLGAVEYALFRELDAASDPGVCSLATSASDVAAAETRALEEAWTVSSDGGDPFLEEFTGTMTSNQALGDVIGAVVETLKRQSLFELGKALGISAPDPEIESVPEGAAGEATAAYIAQLEGVRDVLAAGDTNSLGSLIRARSGEVADRIEDLLDDSLDRLTTLQGPMRALIVESSDQVEPIYDNLAELRVLFESDVVSLLDITLGFSDTDGDTG